MLPWCKARPHTAQAQVIPPAPSIRERRDRHDLLVVKLSKLGLDLLHHLQFSGGKVSLSAQLSKLWEILHFETEFPFRDRSVLERCQLAASFISIAMA